ncbi:tripartite tricarboxylate transporter permease [Nonomuraea angiospora]|uniref:tripartite tricarboxylate transporter permease n=1 Tax=Nonomuraea angiospora TaxID=46172 RepID=UPI00332D9C18
MDVLADLLGGLATALSPQNLLYAFIGCLLGTLIGVLPGIGPVAGVALLIPLTLNLDPTSAIIMLAAIFYGTQYGGTITSVLLNTPGEAASAITTIDGYAMTKQGRAGVALTIAAVGSFVGGTVATVGLVVAAKPLGDLGLRIGPPEFFALMVLGISLLVALAGRSMTKALISGVLGLLISMVGIDPVAGAPRFTFGSERLLDGISFVAVIIGLFGLSEILVAARGGTAQAVAPGLRALLPGRADLRRSVPAIARGTGIGFALGLVPGMTGSVSSLLAYGAERRFSRHRAELGSGAVEGVAGPETANNAPANGALVPLFTLGIPASPTIAVLMGAFLQQGLTPGPTLFAEHADVAWGIIASLFVGNVILLVLNVPLVRLWTSILRIPYPVLTALILTFMVVGAYTINFSVFDVFVMVAFGLLGLVLRRLDIPLAPLVLTLVLGPLMERSLRESLELSQGDLTVFLTRPICVVLLVIALAIAVSPLLSRLLGLRKPAVLAEDPEA